METLFDTLFKNLLEVVPGVAHLDLVLCLTAVLFASFVDMVLSPQLPCPE